MQDYLTDAVERYGAKRAESLLKRVERASDAYYRANRRAKLAEAARKKAAEAYDAAAEMFAPGRLATRDRGNLQGDE